MIRSALTRCAPLLLALTLTACASAPRQTEPAVLPPELDARDPLAATMLLQQGETLMTEGKTAEAKAKFEAALKMQPKNPTIYNLLGVAELQSKNPPRALQLFTDALQLAPSYSDARNNRGTAYLQLGQWAMAEADYLGVLSDRTYANRDGVYFNLGGLYFQRGNLAAAEENLRKASSPSGPIEALLLLGQVEERLGKTESAEVALREAMSRAPERPDAVLALAQLLDRLGRADEARELYKKVLTIAPNSPQADVARAHAGS